jgi:hypothetical protein
MLRAYMLCHNASLPFLQCSAKVHVLSVASVHVLSRTLSTVCVWTCCSCLRTSQDVQTRVQMATQACGFITIVSGTFLLHTTKDLDLTRLQLEDMVRSSSSGQDDPTAATGGSASVGARSVRERRGGTGRLEMQSNSIELGKGSAGIEVTVEAGETGGGAGVAGGVSAEDEQHPLLGAGGNAGSGAAGTRKVRAPPAFGL